MSPVRRTKTRIGEFLLQKGLLTSEQLQEALVLQHKQGQDKKLGQILIELGYVNKEELCLSLAIQCGYPYINIDHCVIDPDILSLIPENIVKQKQVLPIDKIGDVVTVAMADPLDRAAIDEIQKITNCSVKVFLTTPLEHKEIMLKFYGNKQEG